MERGAILSSNRKHRYQLWRIWDNSKETIAFVGLNPSYADEQKDDRTINRCISFTKSWGYGGFYMINLFSYISTDPSELLCISDPIGEENDEHIKHIVAKSKIIVCAWGNQGILKNRHEEVLKLIPDHHYLKINASGQPSHPLYLSSSLLPKKFTDKLN